MALSKFVGSGKSRRSGGDELFLDEFDINQARRMAKSRDFDENLAYGEAYSSPSSSSYDDEDDNREQNLQLSLRRSGSVPDEAVLNRALERIRKARAKGKSNVNLSQEEIEALQLDRQRQKQQNASPAPRERRHQQQPQQPPQQQSPRQSASSHKSRSRSDKKTKHSSESSRKSSSTSLRERPSAGGGSSSSRRSPPASTTQLSTSSSPYPPALTPATTISTHQGSSPGYSPLAYYSAQAPDPRPSSRAKQDYQAYRPSSRASSAPKVSYPTDPMAYQVAPYPEDDRMPPQGFQDERRVSSGPPSSVAYSAVTRRVPVGGGPSARYPMTTVQVEEEDDDDETDSEESSGDRTPETAPASRERSRRSDSHDKRRQDAGVWRRRRK